MIKALYLSERIMHTIIPNPTGTVMLRDNRISLPEKLSINFGNFEPWCADAFLLRTGCTAADGKAWITLKTNTALSKEGYRVQISGAGIVIYAAAESGVIWALTSIYHLLDENQTLPVCTITDKPKYSYRGQSLDCARHFFSADIVKQVIEQLSLVKINVLHWHLTDDQAWRIESKAFPKLHETSGQYYTWNEIRDIVEYARIRGVEVIPEVDLPGHTTGILAAYPEYSCFGETVSLATAGGIYPVILCAGKEITFELIAKLLDEICPLFPSDRFHIGGDEAPKSEWQKCPDCRKRMDEEGLANAEDLQGYFSIRVAEMLKKYGKKPICWNDSLKADKLPDDTLIQYWTAQHLKQMEHYYAAGGPFIYSDMFDLYFDYPHSMIPLKRVYNLAPVIGRSACGGAENLVGIESCLWAEHIATPEQLFTKLFPRAYATAEAAWSTEKDYENFKRRLIPLTEKAEKAGVTVTAESWWNPKGTGRRDEAIAYMANMAAAIPKNAKDTISEGNGDFSAFLNGFATKFFRPADIPYLLKLFKK